jgi:endonuclease-3
MNKAKRQEFYRRLAVLNPEPRGELNWHNPYTLLVAVV